MYVMDLMTRFTAESVTRDFVAVQNPSSLTRPMLPHTPLAARMERRLVRDARGLYVSHIRDGGGISMGLPLGPNNSFNAVLCKRIFFSINLHFGT